MRSIALVYSVAGFLGLGLISPSWAQDEKPVVIQIDELLKGAFQPAPDPVESVAFLSSPFLLAGDSEATHSYINQFANVPTLRGDSIEAFGKTPIRQILARVSRVVEIGERRLSQADRAELNAARKILFEKPDDPNSGESRIYNRYKQFEADHQKTLEQLHASNNEAERLQLQQRLERIERDWQLMGARDRVAQALNVMNTLGGGTRETRGLRDDWARLLGSDSPSLLSTVWSSFDSPAGWQAISTAEKPLLLAASISAGEAQRDIPVQVESISFRFRLVNITDNALIHPFLRRNNWRTSDGSQVSDGNPATTGQAELVPSFFSSLIVVHVVEVRFTDDRASQQLREMLKNSERVSLGGFPIKVPGSNNVFVASRYLCITDPVVVGAIVQRLPKIPDPASNIDW